MPSHTRRLTGAPRKPESRAAQTGWVATSAVALATVVKLSDGIQVAKCRASSSPATTVSRISRRSRARSSARQRSSATGSSTPDAIALRQKAIASAGAAVAAMSGPEVLTVTSATHSSSASVPCGRPSPGMSASVFAGAVTR